MAKCAKAHLDEAVDGYAGSSIHRKLKHYCRLAMNSKWCLYMNIVNGAHLHPALPVYSSNPQVLISHPDKRGQGHRPRAQERCLICSLCLLLRAQLPVQLLQPVSRAWHSIHNCIHITLRVLKGLSFPLQERESDLRLFVEVTHTFVGDSRELGEVRAAEAKLREQVGRHNLLLGSLGNRCFVVRVAGTRAVNVQAEGG